MDEDKYKVLIERVDRIQIVVDKIEADIDKIYKDNQELSIRVGGAENQLRELREAVQHLPQDTKDKVTAAVKPVITEAKELKETIKEKEGSSYERAICKFLQKGLAVDSAKQNINNKAAFFFFQFLHFVT